MSRWGSGQCRGAQAGRDPLQLLQTCHSRGVGTATPVIATSFARLGANENRAPCSKLIKNFKMATAEHWLGVGPPEQGPRVSVHITCPRGHGGSGEEALTPRFLVSCCGTERSHGLVGGHRH